MEINLLKNWIMRKRNHQIQKISNEINYVKCNFNGSELCVCFSIRKVIIKKINFYNFTQLFRFRFRFRLIIIISHSLFSINFLCKLIKCPRKYCKIAYKFTRWIIIIQYTYIHLNFVLDEKAIKSRMQENYWQDYKIIIRKLKL